MWCIPQRVIFVASKGCKQVSRSKGDLFSGVRGRVILRSSVAKRWGTALRLEGWLRKPIWS
jgi:hypothetical protein